MAQWVTICKNCKTASIGGTKCSACEANLYKTNYTDIYWSKQNAGKKQELLEDALNNPTLPVSTGEEAIVAKKGKMGIKILIYIGFFFALAVIETAIRSSGVILGAIPTMILFGGTAYLAGKCGKIYDEKAGK